MKILEICNRYRIFNIVKNFRLFKRLCLNEQLKQEVFEAHEKLISEKIKEATDILRGREKVFAIGMMLLGEKHLENMKLLYSKDPLMTSEELKVSLNTFKEFLYCFLQMCVTQDKINEGETSIHKDLEKTEEKVYGEFKSRTEKKA